MATIVCVGEALVEIMRTERDRPLDRPALFGGPYPSGAPAISASCAARLGASVGFIGTLGDDAFGACVRNRLAADGIDCSALATDPDRLTAIAFVAYRSDGGRSFVFHLAHAAAAQVRMEQVPPGYLDETRYLHLMGSSLSASESLRETCYALAKAVHEAGGVISLDPNLRSELLPVERIRDVCAPIVERARIVMPSGEELLTLTGAATLKEGAHYLIAQGVEIVALKRGEEGSTLYTADGALDIPPYTVQEVDPTGAGDSYDAALLVGLSESWDLYRAGLFANAVGALATTRLGPMEALYARDEVLRFMAEQGRPLP